MMSKIFSPKVYLLMAAVVIFSVAFISISVLADENSNSTDTQEVNGTSGDEDLEISTETTIPETTITNDTFLRFVMRVRWGNVEGEVSDKTETNFDGSVALSNTGTQGGHVTLLREEQFEQHNDTRDLVTSKKDPVSWNSLIYGHWDGVRVLVSGPASAQVTVTTTQGSITKTVEELYKADEPIVQDAGNGKEIVLKTHPFKNRNFFLKVLWGQTNREPEAGDVKYNFSGSLELSHGGKIKLVKTIRFENGFRCVRNLDLLNEEAHKLCNAINSRDKILDHSRSKIEWQSSIQGGVDGIIVRVNLAKDVRAGDTLTLKFPELGYEKSFVLIDLFQNQVTNESILGLPDGYGVTLEVWEKPNKHLLRAEGNPDVFEIEDGMKRKINSPGVFTDNGFEWSDIEEVSEEELAGYADGDEVPYPDGSVLQGSGPQVFVIADGKKRHVVSPQAFEGLGYKWGLIKKVPDSELNLHDEGIPLTGDSTQPEGALIRVEGTPTVWLIENGKRRPITSLAVFFAHKFDWKNVLVVGSTARDNFLQGESATFDDGSLLSGPDGRTYLIDGGKKRWIRSALDLINAGYKWEDIVTVSAQELAKHATGDDVRGDDVD